MPSRAHTGFTLIELMVSMALTLVIMTILAQAFVLALDTFSGLKGLGDMQVNLRTAMVLMRSDLGSDHFEGNRRLSDLNIITTVPEAGFSISHGSAPSTVAASPYFDEGQDQNGLFSYRAVNHVLYFTAKRKGNRQENFFTTVLQDPSVVATSLSPALTSFFSVQTAYNINANQLASATLTDPYPPPATSPQNQAFYSSQWAEVLYYLVPTGTTTDPSITGAIPTYSLYRAQFVMLPEGANLSGLIANTYVPTTVATFQGMSCNTGTNGLTFYSPQLVAAGSANRTITTTSDLRLAPGSIATTLVLPNVISFQVQVMPTAVTNFINVPADGSGNRLFDTTSFNTAGANTFGLKAIQITLRVWDVGTRQTRQATIVQNL